MDFMDSYPYPPSLESLQYFEQKEGKPAVKQLSRVLRQKDRMSYVCSVIGTGKGMDPDTQQKIIIPEQFFETNNWDDKLNDALQLAHDEGYNLKVIDGCFYLGVYASDFWRIRGNLAFNKWFDEAGGTVDCPRARLIDCMRDPLALPVFSLNIPEDYKFDILFGRKHVCMGICIDLFLDACKKEGYSVRFSTKKEYLRLKKENDRPFEYKGSYIFIGNTAKEGLLYDGVFLRIMFHGQTPMSTIRAIMESILSE
jgi:hypothetical protein